MAIEPVATEVVTGAIDSAARTVEDAAGAAAQSDLSASTKTIDAAVPSPQAVANSVSEVTDEAGALRTTAAVVSGSQQQVTRLAESVRQNAAKTIERIRQESATVIASATKRPPAIPALPELLDSIAPARVAAVPPTAGPTPEIASIAETGGAASLLEQTPAGSLSRLDTVALTESMGKYLVQPDGVGTVGFAASDRPDRGGEARSSSPAAGSKLADIASDRFASPPPVNIPLPTPGSPATTASGSGGSSFVPLVALLALLALAAPATLRRLWEAPDFRAPTPFVCALERPG